MVDSLRLDEDQLALLDRLAGEVSCIREEPHRLVYAAFPGGDRTPFDVELCLPTEGWQSVDTEMDGPDFGIWAHAVSRTVVGFVEGEVYVTFLVDQEAYRAEIEALLAFYEPRIHPRRPTSHEEIAA